MFRGLRASPGSQTCVPLQNHGTHSTIDVAVGTPGQTFSVVADTGSNSLIVPSCICQKAGYCKTTNRCFIGTNKSSTFSLEGSAESPASVMLSFGSGMVKAVVAHDKVRIGTMEHQMQDGLLLMTANALRISGPFEGILGLGPPIPEEVLHPNATSAGEEDQQDGAIPLDQIAKIMQGIMGEGGSDADISDIISKAMGGKDGGASDFPMSLLSPISEPFAHIRNGTQDNQSSESSEVTGFLEQAKIEHFSICFNEGSDGVLRLGTPETNKKMLDSAGTAHWGVDLRGISVGDVSARLEICNGANMTEGQKTPCGGIPDSGTTAIMAPKEHASILFEAICDNWQRCAENYTALVKAAAAAKKAAEDSYGVDPFDISVSNSSKGEVLKLLLFDCETWMNESSGFAELPPLHFHVADSKGIKQTLEIPGVSYVMQTGFEDLDKLAKEANVSVASLTGGKQMICQPAISEFEYETEKNGPVFILGTPFFYEYNVGYNMVHKTISFTSTKEEACGACDSNVGFVTTGRHTANAATRRPRMARWPWRKPSIDVTKPM